MNSNQALGVVINRRSRTITFENGDEEQGRKLLLCILAEMAGEDFDFAHIEKKGDRETFLGRFAALAVKPPADAPKPPPIVVAPPVASPPTAAPPKAVRPTPHHGSRETLAPKSRPNVLKVTGVRLNPLYEECRNIVVARARTRRHSCFAYSLR